MLNAFNLKAWDLSMSWDVVDWLRGITKLPLIIKGVLTGRDAHRAIVEQVDAIIVSSSAQERAAEARGVTADRASVEVGRDRVG